MDGTLTGAAADYLVLSGDFQQVRHHGSGRYVNRGDPEPPRDEPPRRPVDAGDGPHRGPARRRSDHRDAVRVRSGARAGGSRPAPRFSCRTGSRGGMKASQGLAGPSMETLESSEAERLRAISAPTAGSTVIRTDGGRADSLGPATIHRTELRRWRTRGDTAASDFIRLPLRPFREEEALDRQTDAAPVRG
jgi:hypothetical protein